MHHYAKGLLVTFEQLLLSGESQTLEFKSGFDKATVESLVAFANAQGGTVLVGISDAGKVLGVRRNCRSLHAIAATIMGRTPGWQASIG